MARALSSAACWTTREHGNLPEDSLPRRHSDSRQVLPVDAEAKTNTELIVIVTPEIVSLRFRPEQPLPTLKFPAKFLPPNSGIPMNTPDAKTAANTPPPPPQTMPVEKLIESMKPEKPLVVSGESGSFGGSSSTSTTSTETSPSQ